MKTCDSHSPEAQLKATNFESYTYIVIDIKYIYNIYKYIYKLYIYIEREREIERERHCICELQKKNFFAKDTC